MRNILKVRYMYSCRYILKFGQIHAISLDVSVLHRMNVCRCLAHAKTLSCMALRIRQNVWKEENIEWDKGDFNAINLFNFLDIKLFILHKHRAVYI